MNVCLSASETVVRSNDYYCRGSRPRLLPECVFDAGFRHTFQTLLGGTVVCRDIMLLLMPIMPISEAAAVTYACCPAY